ncbi:MAG TPA: histidine phosphatase family protein [Haliangiales bacterium]|nr:histidine phosphatase family protein [Haliangiales bacterium]
METLVYLVRHGVTDWHRDRRVLGQRDVGLNSHGVAQAHAATRALAELPITEVVSSPMLRAMQTAEVVAAQFGTGVARDPRLTDFRVGAWEGMPYDEVAASPEYQRFVADPLSERIPGGEDLVQVRDRAVGAVEQALRDAPAGESIVIVTHAGIVRVILAHFLGSHLANYHRVRVSPGSISIMSFRDDRSLPRVLAVNWLPNLKEVL